MKVSAYSKELIGLLKMGGIIAHPADTCFGLAGDLMNEKALQKLQVIKGREAQKPMSIMLPLTLKTELSDYVRLDDFSSMVCDRLLPGPVTIVLPKGPKIPSFFFPETDSIGIRIPDDLQTQEILKEFNGPLITTSANLSGQPPCSSDEEVRKMFEGEKAQPDLIIEGVIAHDCLPSTVIKVEDGKVTILREGPIKISVLEKILQTKLT